MGVAAEGTHPTSTTTPPGPFWYLQTHRCIHNPSSANQSGCFRNKLFFCFQNHPGARARSLSSTSLSRYPWPPYSQTLQAPLPVALQPPAPTLTEDGWAQGTKTPPSQSRLTSSFLTFAPDSQSSNPHLHSGLFEKAQPCFRVPNLSEIN